MKCMICGYENPKSILSHVRNIHRMSAAQYREKFPGCALREAWVKRSEENLEKFRQIGRANSEKMAGNRSHAAIPDGAWSRAYPCCVKCGKTDNPHLSQGVCKNCFYSAQQAAETIKVNRERFSSGEDGVDYVTCLVCNNPYESLTTHGHLAVHSMTEDEYKLKFPNAILFASKLLKRQGEATSKGRIALHKKRGYLNPESMRKAKQKEMTRRHATDDFSKVSKIEVVVGDWFIRRGYELAVGAVFLQDAGAVLWQHVIWDKYCVDFAFLPGAVVVEVLGDWWHGWDCLTGKMKYEDVHPKVKKNMHLDKARFKELEAGGWTVVKIWEHEIKDGSFIQAMEARFPQIPRALPPRYSAMSLLEEAKRKQAPLTPKDVIPQMDFS